MTNPDNAIGTNGAYNGRTSVEAFNDIMGVFSSRGVLSGWECAPSSGMTVALGGVAGTRDVAVAEDASGNFTSINNRSGSPVEVTLSAAPASNSRIDSVVAYVTNPPEGDETTADNPDACGIIAVSGTASSSPSAPSDSAIRTAITGDGGSGSTAYYVVLANITVAAGTTDITADVVEAGAPATIQEANSGLDAFNQNLVWDTSGDFMVASGYTKAVAYLKGWGGFGKLVFVVKPNSGNFATGTNIQVGTMVAPAGWKFVNFGTRPTIVGVSTSEWHVQSTAASVYYQNSNTEGTQAGIHLRVVSGSYNYAHITVPVLLEPAE